MTMRYSIFVLFIFFIFYSSAFAQKYFTKTGQISFYSKAALENIEAHSKTALAIFDTESGNFEWSVLIKSFQFEKALMQEHFNENYMESHKFPKAVFKGKIDDFHKIDFSQNGNHSLKVTGKLTIHGVTNDFSANGTITIADGEILCNSEIDVILADYNIAIPSVVRDNIAKNVKIKVSANLQPFKSR